MSMNCGIFSGFLGRDAETKTTPSGQQVCSFPLAVKNGEKTLWLEVSIWGKSAEAAGKHLKKGSGVEVSGRVGFEEFKRRDGSTGQKITLNCSGFEFPPVAKGGESRETSDRSAYREPDRPARESQYSGGGTEDDLPF